MKKISWLTMAFLLLIMGISVCGYLAVGNESAIPETVQGGEILFHRLSPHALGKGGTLWIMDIDGTNEKQLVCYDESISGGITYVVGGGYAWSSNGEEVGFISTYVWETPYSFNNIPPTQINIISIDGGNLKRVAEVKGLSEIAWSPKLDKIAYMQNEFSNKSNHPVGLVSSNTYIMKADGTIIKGFYSKDKHLYINPVWSPNGQKILFSYCQFSESLNFDKPKNLTESGIVIMDCEGENEKRFPKVDGYNFAWSSDGKQLAFISKYGGGNKIFIMNSDGSNLKMIASISDDVKELTWSHAKKRLAYIKCGEKENALWVVDLNVGISKNIVSNIGKIIGWDKDDKTLFYEYGHIYSISVEGGEPKQITKSGSITKSYRNPVLLLK